MARLGMLHGRDGRTSESGRGVFPVSDEPGEAAEIPAAAVSPSS